MTAQHIPSVNILPTDRFEYTKTGRFLSWALTTGRYVVVVIELVVILAFLSRFWFDRTLSDLRETRIAKEAVVDSYNDTLLSFLRRQTQLAKIGEIVGQQYGVSNRLSQIQDLTPVGIEYQEIVTSSPSASIRGFATNAPTFSLFLSNLQRKDVYEEVIVKSLKLSAQHPPGFDFELQLSDPVSPDSQQLKQEGS